MRAALGQLNRHCGRGPEHAEAMATILVGSVPFVQRACGDLLSFGVVQKNVRPLVFTVSSFFLVDPVHAGGRCTRESEKKVLAK